MAKVTSKLEVTVPQAIADQFGIRPGDEVEILPGDDGSLRILLLPEKLSDRVEDRLRSFDEATRRQREREKRQPPREPATDRGWTREELYDRGRPD